MTRPFDNFAAALLTMAALFPAGAHADVTVQQKTALEVASLIHLHGATTTNVSADKKREDTESHCEGMLSLVCGNIQGGEIVRLDKAVTWRLEPNKKRYREEAFATPEEMAALRAKMQANLEKMRSCPAVQKQPQPVDTSKCQMSPPKIDVLKTDEKLSIAGHDTKKTTATLTQTCTDKQTGDVCDTVVAIDLWLTQDTLPGSGDRRAFDAAYAKKLGLEDAQGIMRGEALKYLAPYQAQIKQLTDKSSDFTGQPLKTSLKVMMGGAQCGAASKSKSNTADAAGTTGNAGGDASSTNPLADVTQAGKALGSMMGGLFHKKKADAAQDSPPATAAPPPANDPFSQYVQLASFSMETMSITTDPVPAARFEIPVDWRKETPKPAKNGDDSFSCPAS